jgi:squalene synthase HpnC
MGVDHYENFPVASVLMPASLRPAVKAIYRFARTADDFADEGDAPCDVRLAALQTYRDALAHLAQGKPANALPHSLQSVFVPLAAAIDDHDLGIETLDRLLSAFMQDVTQTRYPDFETLIDYCRHSADPVGRLLLRLYKADTPENNRDADAICTALQLINFWQDIALDWEKGRVYLPKDSLLQFGVDESQIAKGHVDPAWQALMAFELARTRVLMSKGAKLALRLPGRIGWELRLVVLGGLRILEKIEKVEYDVFRQRPKLDKTDWLKLAVDAVFFRLQFSASDL